MKTTSLLKHEIKWFITRYTGALLALMVLGAIGLMSYPIYPVAGAAILAGVLLGPGIVGYLSFKTGDKRSCVVAILVLITVLGSGVGIIQSGQHLEQQVKNEQAREQANKIEREFLPFNSAQLVGLLSPIPVLKLVEAERMRGPGSGFDIFEFAPGNVSEVYFFGYDGRVEKLTLELGQSYDAITNQDQLKIGARLMAALGLEKWFNAEVDSVDWSNPLLKGVSGKGVSIVFPCLTRMILFAIQ